MAATIMAVGRMLLFALLGTTHLATDKGYATAFGSRDDMLTGGTMACTGKRIEPDDMICAHRSLPCGTPVLIQTLRTKRVATCTVQDRGPYGATLPNGEIILKISPKEEGSWRGLIDVSPAVAEALGLTGREQVSVIYERPQRRRVPARWTYQASSPPPEWAIR